MLTGICFNIVFNDILIGKCLAVDKNTVSLGSFDIYCIFRVDIDLKLSCLVFFEGAVLLLCERKGCKLRLGITFSCKNNVLCRILKACSYLFVADFLTLGNGIEICNNVFRALYRILTDRAKSYVFLCIEAFEISFVGCFGNVFRLSRLKVTEPSVKPKEPSCGSYCENNGYS
jgi:hypothetical protein